MFDEKRREMINRAALHYPRIAMGLIIEGLILMAWNYLKRRFKRNGSIV